MEEGFSISEGLGTDGFKGGPPKMCYIISHIKDHVGVAGQWMGTEGILKM